MHSLTFDMPGDGGGGTCWIPDIGVGKLKGHGKGGTGHTKCNSEKEEGRDAQSAGQSDGNRKGEPGDSEGGSAAGWSVKESEFG